MLINQRCDTTLNVCHLDDMITTLSKLRGVIDKHDIVNYGETLPLALQKLGCYTEAEILTILPWAGKFLNFKNPVVKVKVKAFEKQVWETENIKIMLRASKYAEVYAYTYNRPTVPLLALDAYFSYMLRPLIDDYEVEIVWGENKPVDVPKLTLGVLRASYVKPNTIKQTHMHG